MSLMNEQQSRNVKQPPQHNSNKDNLAIASLVLGILSILSFLFSMLSFLFATLAIIFGALSLKSRKKAIALSGIITGVVSIIIAIIIIVISITTALLSKKDINVQTSTDSASSISSENLQSDSKSENMATFSGDGYELIYSDKLWKTARGSMDNSNEVFDALKYVMDDTALIPNGVSGMLGYSTSTKEERDKLYNKFYDVAQASVSESEEIVGDTDTFENLRDDIYYATYSLYDENKMVLSRFYVVASESDDIIVTFVARTGSLTKSEPNIPIMPILYSINFTERLETDEPNADESDTNTTVQEMQRVGEEHYGFWDVPQDWVVFKELNPAEGDTMIQYSDPHAQNIITVRYFADSDKTPEELLKAHAAYLEEIDGKNIIGSKVELNGIDALQVYCGFPDNTMMVSWAFQSDDGELHFIIAEGPTDTITETVSYLESSYSLDK